MKSLRNTNNSSIAFNPIQNETKLIDASDYDDSITDLKWLNNRVFYETTETTTFYNYKKFSGYVENMQNIYYNPYKNHDDFSFTNIKNKFLRFSATSVILVLLLLVFCMLSYKLKSHFASNQRSTYAFTLASSNYNANGQTITNNQLIDSRPYPACYQNTFNNNNNNQIPLINNAPFYNPNQHYTDAPPSYSSLNIDNRNVK